MTTNTNNSDPPPRAAVPANVNEADRIAFGLTFRQLAILGGVGLAGSASTAPTATCCHQWCG